MSTLLLAPLASASDGDNVDTPTTFSPAIEVPKQTLKDLKAAAKKGSEGGESACEPVVKILPHISTDPVFSAYKTWSEELKNTKGRVTGAKALIEANKEATVKLEELLTNREAALLAARLDYTKDLAECDRLEAWSAAIEEARGARKELKVEVRAAAREMKKVVKGKKGKKAKRAERAKKRSIKAAKKDYRQSLIAILGTYDEAVKNGINNAITAAETTYNEELLALENDEKLVKGLTVGVSKKLKALAKKTKRGKKVSADRIKLDLNTVSSEVVTITQEEKALNTESSALEAALLESLGTPEVEGETDNVEIGNILVCPTKESILRWNAEGAFNAPLGGYASKKETGLNFAARPKPRNIDCLRAISKLMPKVEFEVYKSDYYPGPPRKKVGSVVTQECPRKDSEAEARCASRRLDTAGFKCEEIINGNCSSYEFIHGGITWISGIEKDVAAIQKRLGVKAKYEQLYNKVVFTDEPSAEENARFKKLAKLRLDNSGPRGAPAQMNPGIERIQRFAKRVQAWYDKYAK